MSELRRGFTLLEVMVSALLIGLVLMGMGSVLAAYSSSRVKINAQVTARHIAQGAIDEVLMHGAIENSLMTDEDGRSRPVYLQNNKILVSNYFYYNFPTLPASGHDQTGMIWSDWAADGASRYTTYPGALFTQGGGPIPGSYTTLSDEDAQRVGYIARIQVYGLKSDVGGTTWSLEQYLSAGSELIADTALASASPLASGSEVANASYRSKLYVVRVYDRKTLLSPPAGLVDSGGKPKTDLTHAFAVISGPVRL